MTIRWAFTRTAPTRSRRASGSTQSSLSSWSGHKGLTFSSAMGLIVLEGIVVTLLVLSGLREQIMRAIPVELKKAIAIGIGLFIAFIGFVRLGDRRARCTRRPAGRSRPPHDVADRRRRSSASLFTIVLRARGFRGDLLARDRRRRRSSPRSSTRRPTTTAFGTTAATWPGLSTIGQTGGTSGLFGKFDFHAFSKLGVVSAIVWVFSLFLSDFFDTMGTLDRGRQAGRLSRRRRASCRRSASRCSSTRSRRSPAAPRRPRRRRPTSSPARASGPAGGQDGSPSSAACSSSRSSSWRRSSAWCRSRRPRRRSSSSAT